MTSTRQLKRTYPFSKFQFAFLSLCLSLPAAANSKYYSDLGACPFECCTYREWVAEKETPLYSGIDQPTIVKRLSKGDHVIAVTGEVRTSLRNVTYTTQESGIRPPSPIQEGDQVSPLTYEGNGYWKVMKNGKVIKNVPQGWPPDENPSSVWWVRIQYNQSGFGWTNRPGNFGNKDRCN